MNPPRKQPTRFCPACGKHRKQKYGQCKVCQSRIQTPKRIRVAVEKGLGLHA